MPLSEAQAELAVVLQRYEHVDVHDVRLLQSLSICDLSEAQKKDGDFDLLTGFQLIDGAHASSICIVVP